MHFFLVWQELIGITENCKIVKHVSVFIVGCSVYDRQIHKV